MSCDDYKDILFLDLACLITAGSMDPGIIPRNPRNKELLEAYVERVKDPYYQKLPEKKEITVKDQEVTIKYCNTCNVS
jgi:hypothetical protein